MKKKILKEKNNVPIQLINDTDPDTYFLGLIGERINWWIKVHKFPMFFLNNKSDYSVSFIKKVEIFDLIECRINISIGTKRWEGMAWGMKPYTAFESAVVEIKAVKPVN